MFWWLWGPGAFVGCQVWSRQVIEVRGKGDGALSEELGVEGHRRSDRPWQDVMVSKDGKPHPSPRLGRVHGAGNQGVEPYGWSAGTKQIQG